MALTRNGLSGHNENPNLAGYLLQQLGSTPVTVANLPSAATVGSGARNMVSDASATTFAATIGVSGKTVAGGGSNTVPVYSDGVNWRVG